MSSREYVATFESGFAKEVRVYDSDKLVTRIGIIRDKDNRFIGVRMLAVENVAPSSWFSFWNIFKKKNPEVAFPNLKPLDFIGVLERITASGTSTLKGVLKGEDNTEVSSTSSSYLLKKTLVLFSVKSENPINEIGWNLRLFSAGTTAYGKITVESSAVSETTEDEQETAEIVYQYYFKALSREYSGSWVKIRVYLKHIGAAPAHNTDCKVYGKTTEEIVYV